MINPEQSLEDIKTELDDYVQRTFREEIGTAREKEATVEEVEEATSGRKEMFRYLVNQKVFKPGRPLETYLSRFERETGEFTARISIGGTRNTEIHARYSAKDRLIEAHFKPSSEPYQHPTNLNRVDQQFCERLVERPMRARYGATPWGTKITPRR